VNSKFLLFRRVLSSELPPRALLWGLLNKLNFLLKTGNRRYEFERLYIECGDAWNYRTSSYEQEKYQCALAAALKWRRSNIAALEIGCSIGVFSKMLASHFRHTVAIDVSLEAIRAALAYNRDTDNLKFLQVDLRSFDAAEQFDVVVCAEVLYYIVRKDAHLIPERLDKLLSADGILVYVSGAVSGIVDPMHFEEWEALLSGYLAVLEKMIVDDPRRPYEIIVFGRRR
jgi:SAM-dependent methyltransferase